MSNTTNPQEEEPPSTAAFFEQAQKKREIYQAAAVNDKRKVQMTRDTLGGDEKMNGYIAEHQEFVSSQSNQLPTPTVCDDN